MTMIDLVEKARLFATVAHAAIGQTRKYTNDPYIVHPEAVARIVASVDHTQEMLAAAWLHDVVEDTEVDEYAIKAEFGWHVAALVRQLTDVSKLEDGNRAERKAIDRAHTALACAAAKTIKLADLIDNTRSIVAHDPEFARTYLREKALLLEVLREGDPQLWAIADEQINRSMAQVALASRRPLREIIYPIHELKPLHPCAREMYLNADVSLLLSNGPFRMKDSRAQSTPVGDSFTFVAEDVFSDIEKKL
jgi:hypothetical protein